MKYTYRDDPPPIKKEKEKEKENKICTLFYI